MELVNNDLVMFNILLHSDVDTIERMCFISDIIEKIRDNKYFWIQKFEQDNLMLLNYPENNDWISEYKEVVFAITDADDIIKISLIEKERDKKINIIFPNDGTIIIRFSDYDSELDYDLWLLPQELTSLVPAQLDDPDFEVYPVQIKFTLNNDNTYKLIYELFCSQNNIQDVEVVLDDLSINDVREILIKSVYDDIRVVDHMGTNYLFDNREPYHEQRTNSKYYNMIKNSRLGMRDSFEYIRKNP